jgi:hypothetical protein
VVEVGVPVRLDTNEWLRVRQIDAEGWLRIA